MEAGVDYGEDYVNAMAARESDRRARQAFQELVFRIAAPGQCIFDFGAGPGLDAKLYAQHGLKVLAYDVDPRMCASFARRCGPEIQSGQITLFQGTYPEFLRNQVPAIRRQHGVDLVTANFAPLSMIDDISELFGRFHELTAPKAKVLASVLNPDFVGNLRYSWWWANRWRYWRHGSFYVKSKAANIYRRSVDDFAAHAAPHFTLTNVMRGLPRKAGAPVKSSSRLTLATSQFAFLLFSKQ
jgi:SAM-dependent methyltransferase